MGKYAYCVRIFDKSDFCSGVQLLQNLKIKSCFDICLFIHSWTRCDSYGNQIELKILNLTDTAEWKASIGMSKVPTFWYKIKRKQVAIAGESFGAKAAKLIFYILNCCDFLICGLALEHDHTFHPLAIARLCQNASWDSFWLHLSWHVYMTSYVYDVICIWCHDTRRPGSPPGSDF